MPHDSGTPSFREWHAALATNDVAARAAEDARVRSAAVATLEERLDTAAAELRALRASVTVRDNLLREQQVALAERDARIDQLVTTTSPPARRPLARRALSRARRYAAGMRARIAA
ncbi:hypothetical protein [uncultured Cellulomonas sp.]|uniref:hypothetical protein n=1 Tax=uncultured Cellulomonas sp. TaxID=189682 RepID=UPI0028EFD158|nr:hypothetical protein [uncultured Cellulomonas sp.]